MYHSWNLKLINYKIQTSLLPTAVSVNMFQPMSSLMFLKGIIHSIKSFLENSRSGCQKHIGLLRTIISFFFILLPAEIFDTQIKNHLQKIEKILKMNSTPQKDWTTLQKKHSNKNSKDEDISSNNSSNNEKKKEEKKKKKKKKKKSYNQRFFIFFFTHFYK